jgi:hypothetical protein
MSVMVVVPSHGGLLGDAPGRCTVDIRDDRGDLGGVYAVEVQVHLAQAADRLALRRWERPRRRGRHGPGE